MRVSFWFLVKIDSELRVCFNRLLISDVSMDRWLGSRLFNEPILAYFWNIIGWGSVIRLFPSDGCRSISRPLTEPNMLLNEFELRVFDFYLSLGIIT